MSDVFIFLSLLSAILVGVSVAMERKGLSQLPEITPGDSARNPLKVIRILVFCRLWLAGWIIAQIGWAFAVQAFHIGDFNVVKTLSSLSIAVTTILSVRLLGERLSLLEKLGIILVTVGALFVSAQSQETKPGTVDLVAFAVFSGTALTVAFTLMIVASIIRKRSGSPVWEVTSATAAGIFYSVSSIFHYLASYGAQGAQREFNLFSPESWAQYVFNVPFISGYLIILLGFFSIQSAMSRGRASVAYPISTSLGIALPVLGSALIFGEMIVVPLDGSIQFPLSYLRLIGIIVTIIGGALIQTHSWRTLTTRKEEKTAGNVQDAKKERTIMR